MLGITSVNQDMLLFKKLTSLIIAENNEQFFANTCGANLDGLSY